jgi:nitrite reductase/ring-hydroxylating ferredoxin subunit
MTDPISSDVRAGRRGIVAGLLMWVGVAVGYGLGLVHFFRYLVPLRSRRDTREMFVGTLAEIPVGAGLTVRDPRGQEINIVRAADDRENPERGFKALSSTCPHLGCRVHWEAAHNRFYCPCHQGVFDREGVAQSGPPAKEGKNLRTYAVRVDRPSGQVFVLIEQERRYGV